MDKKPDDKLLDKPMDRNKCDIQKYVGIEKECFDKEVYAWSKNLEAAIAKIRKKEKRN